jgi:hypothetical protein
MKRSILSVALASLLVLSACGSNEDEQAKSSISDYMAKQQPGQQASMKKKDADCIADGMVDGIGVDQLKKYKVLNDDASFNNDVKGLKMSKDDSEVLADTYMKCTDVVKSFKTQAASTPAGQTAEGKKCLDETVTEDNIRTMLVASFSGDQQSAMKFQTDLMKCSTAGAPSPSAKPKN